MNIRCTEVKVYIQMAVQIKWVKRDWLSGLEVMSTEQTTSEWNDAWTNEFFASPFSTSGDADGGVHPQNKNQNKTTRTDLQFQHFLMSEQPHFTLCNY